MKPSILVAGIGNIFLGDDAFGVEVAQRLLRIAWPAHVKVYDYGIRGIDLTYALLDNPGLVILIDAVPRGEAPGTLYLIEPDPAAGTIEEALPETHNMNPMRVLNMAKSMGATLRRVLLLGCEPAPLVEETIGLSEPVAAAVDEAVRMVQALVTDFSKEGDEHEYPDQRILEDRSVDRAGGGSRRHAARPEAIHSHQHDVGA